MKVSLHPDLKASAREVVAEAHDIRARLAAIQKKALIRWAMASGMGAVTMLAMSHRLMMATFAGKPLSAMQIVAVDGLTLLSGCCLFLAGAYHDAARGRLPRCFVVDREDPAWARRLHARWLSATRFSEGIRP